VKAGDKIDVRDTEFIWCIGRVELIITSLSREQLYYIHYEGWNRKYDEYIYKRSSRLAPLGTYTSRNDIPKYQMCPHQNMLFSQILPGVDVNQQGEDLAPPLENPLNEIQQVEIEQIPEQYEEEERQEQEELNVQMGE